jgi:hypothetical protein
MGLMFGVLLVCSATQVTVAGNDNQYWSNYLFKLYHTDKVSIMLFTEAKLYGNFSKPGLYLLCSRVQYKLYDHLDLQMNNTWLKARDSKGDFITQYRIEPEVNPHFTTGNRNILYFRNRVEIRHIENKGWNNTRYRGRAQFTMKLSNSGPFHSVFTDTEFFYDFAAMKHLEQRTTPFGMNLSLAKNIELQLFYMIQRQRGLEDWFSNQIIGSLLTVKL